MQRIYSPLFNIIIFGLTIFLQILNTHFLNVFLMYLFFSCIYKIIIAFLLNNLLHSMLVSNLSPFVGFVNTSPLVFLPRLPNSFILFPLTHSLFSFFYPFLSSPSLPFLSQFTLSPPAHPSPSQVRPLPPKTFSIHHSPDILPTPYPSTSPLPTFRSHLFPPVPATSATPCLACVYTVLHPPRSCLPLYVLCQLYCHTKPSYYCATPCQYLN